MRETIQVTLGVLALLASWLGASAVPLFMARAERLDTGPAVIISLLLFLLIGAMLHVHLGRRIT